MHLFTQLGYQYIRPIYPAERPGSGGSRGGAELAPSGTLSNVLSSMYGAPYAAAAAAQGYGAFLPYAAELPIFPQLVRGTLGAHRSLPETTGTGPAGRDSRWGSARGTAGEAVGRAVRKEIGRYRCPASGELPERGRAEVATPRVSPRSARRL